MDFILLQKKKIPIGLYNEYHSINKDYIFLPSSLSKLEFELGSEAPSSIIINISDYHHYQSSGASSFIIHYHRLSSTSSLSSTSAIIIIMNIISVNQSLLVYLYPPTRVKQAKIIRAEQ